MRWPWRHRYMVAIVGQESGNVTALPFVSFRHYDQAQDWCDQMNDAHAITDGVTGNRKPLTRYEVRRIDWMPGDEVREYGASGVDWATIRPLFGEGRKGDGPSK